LWAVGKMMRFGSARFGRWGAVIGFLTKKRSAGGFLQIQVRLFALSQSFRLANGSLAPAQMKTDLQMIPNFNF